MTTQQRRSLTFVLLFLVLLLGLGLRLFDLGGQSLWNDEGTSVDIAQRDLTTIARDAAQDIHPPLYYWLLSGWVRVWDTGEIAVRSLSVMLGVVLVAVVFVLGRLLAGRWAGLAAALLAAINPFQVYYAQEARMYMLLALCGALVFYAALQWAAVGPGKNALGWGILYVLAAAAGLYTHYAFPMVLLAINLVILLYIVLRRNGLGRWLWPWLAFQGIVLLLYLPWLPTAFRQLTTWPQVDQAFDLAASVTRVGQLFATGPAAPAWQETGGVLLLLLLTFYPAARPANKPAGPADTFAGRRLPALVTYLAPVLWLLVPVVLILGLGLYKEAYLKFLLVASPAFCLLAGRFVASPLGRARRAVALGEGVLAALVAVLLISASVHGLHHYYNNPAYARDDYRGIAAYVDATARPGDAVLLNAPGQQEVFGYYYHGDLPVYPLPQDRPLDPATTEGALAEMARPGARIYAVLWATGESDPDRFVEGWLDSHAYKALDAWHGNVRLVVYAVPEQTPEAPDRLMNVPLGDGETGDEITLLGYSLLDEQLAAGEIAQITLFWQADRTPSRRYKVFIHVLDEGNHIAGQRDAEPGGGVHLTTLWQPGEVVADNHGLPIHPATPPGEYRVEMGMYDAETGRRLTTPEGEGQVWLEPLLVERPPVPPPAAALGMQHTADADFGELTLLGYDAYRLGFSHLPETPLRPGDVLHASLYWRAEAQPSVDWRVALSLVDAGGQVQDSIEAEAVAGYATGLWQAGDVWRGQFNLPISDHVPPGRYGLQIQPITPGGVPVEPYLTESLVVEP